MPLPIVLYSATVCDDSDRTRLRLQQLGLAFEEINIDHHQAAEQFVLVVNGGYRSTPTLLIGKGKLKIVLTEPTDVELDTTLTQATRILDLNMSQEDSP